MLFLGNFFFLSWNFLSKN